MARTKAAFIGDNRLADHFSMNVIASALPRGAVNATLYDQNQRIEKKRKLYIVPRAFLWKTPRLPCSFAFSILHTGSSSPAVTD